MAVHTEFEYLQVNLKLRREVSLTTAYHHYPLENVCIQGEEKVAEDQVQGGVRATLKALKGKRSQ